MEIKNHIAIAHGTTEPTTAILIPYELGFNYSNNVLYINKNGEIVIGYLPLTGGTMTGDLKIGKDLDLQTDGTIVLRDSNQRVLFNKDVVYTMNGTGKFALTYHDPSNSITKDLLFIDSNKASFFEPVSVSDAISVENPNGGYVHIYTDNEGGNITIHPISSYSDFYEIDALFGVFRLIHFGGTAGTTQPLNVTANDFNINTTNTNIGDRLTLKTDGDGGHIIITPRSGSDGNSTKWNLDAYNGQFRAYKSWTGNAKEVFAVAADGGTGRLYVRGGTGSVEIRSDGEGGNIDINSPDPPNIPGAPTTSWEIDAYNGNLRFYCHNTLTNQNTFPLTLSADGLVDVGDRLTNVEYGNATLKFSSSNVGQLPEHLFNGDMLYSPINLLHIGFTKTHNTSPKTIILSCYTSAPYYVYVGYDNPESDGFDLVGYRATKVDTTVSWLAIW